MKNKTVTIHKTTAIGPTFFICTSGHANPLKIDARDRRFLVVEGPRTAKMLAKHNPGAVVVVPHNV